MTKAGESEAQTMHWPKLLLQAFRRQRPAPANPDPVPIPATPDPLDLAGAINQARTGLGLPPLPSHRDLDRVAGWWAGEMARCQQLTHADIASRIAGVLEVAASGETIAMGQRDPQAVVADWLDSPGHRAILTGNYQLLGTGAVADQHGSIYWCADFAMLRDEQVN